MKTFPRASRFPLALALFAACGRAGDSPHPDGGQTADTSPPTVQTQSGEGGGTLIGTEGGTVALVDGTSATLPRGAVGAPTGSFH